MTKAEKEARELNFPSIVPSVATVRAELAFEMDGTERVLRLIEREPLGILPKVIRVPFALLKEAVSQILLVEASEAAVKDGAVPPFKREWLPKGIQRKMQVAEILNKEAQAELEEARAAEAVEEIAPERKPPDLQTPGFDV